MFIFFCKCEEHRFDVKKQRRLPCLIVIEEIEPSRAVVEVE